MTTTDSTNPPSAEYPHLSVAQLTRINALQAARGIIASRTMFSSGPVDWIDAISLAEYIENGTRDPQPDAPVDEGTRSRAEVSVSGVNTDEALQIVAAEARRRSGPESSRTPGQPYRWAPESAHVDEGPQGDLPVGTRVQVVGDKPATAKADRWELIAGRKGVIVSRPGDRFDYRVNIDGEVWHVPAANIRPQITSAEPEPTPRDDGRTPGQIAYARFDEEHPDELVPWEKIGSRAAWEAATQAVIFAHENGTRARTTPEPLQPGTRIRINKNEWEDGTSSVFDVGEIATITAGPDTEGDYSVETNSGVYGPIGQSNVTPIGADE